MKKINVSNIKRMLLLVICRVEPEMVGHRYAPNVMKREAPSKIYFVLLTFSLQILTEQKFKQNCLLTEAMWGEARKFFIKCEMERNYRVSHNLWPISTYKLLQLTGQNSCGHMLLMFLDCWLGSHQEGPGFTQVI